MIEIMSKKYQLELEMSLNPGWCNSFIAKHSLWGKQECYYAVRKEIPIRNKGS